ncbi:hypothetical protein [Krasilnikovia sp. MM14-A1004]|uniref:hypothetical protein n=1 Tax=Krasilnikovia sp. MM14-A1004 TaxID=3373541 RepID=UPI00399CBAB5
MSARATSQYRFRVAGLAAVTAAVALAGCSDTRPTNDGCTSDRDRHRVDSLLSLPLITAHADRAEMVDQGGGCDEDGQISAGREYYWENLDQRGVTAFHQAIATKDGWKLTPLRAQSQAPTNTGRDPDSDLAAGGSWPQPDEDPPCFTKQIDGQTAFAEVAFPDESDHGAYGDVYDVSAWIPGPNDPPGC